MDLTQATRFITRTQKLILGVSAGIAEKFTIRPVVLRTGFVILTLVFIPAGLIAYFAGYALLNRHQKPVLSGGLAGMLLGVPLSYFFQPEMVKRMAGGITGYLRKFGDIVETTDRYVGNGSDVLWNAFAGIAVFSLAGCAIGYFIMKSTNRNT